MRSDEEVREALRDLREDRNLDGAMALLTSRYEGLVAGALPYWLPRDQREDLTQEVLLRVFDKREQLPAEPAAFRAYLSLIVKRECVNWLRREKRKIPATPLDPGRDFEDSGRSSPERSAAAREAIAKLETALQRLPPRQRQVAGLALRGKKNRQIATLLRMRLNTVKSNRAHARRNLRAMLEDVLIDFGIMDDDD